MTHGTFTPVTYYLMISHLIGRCLQVGESTKTTGTADQLIENTEYRLRVKAVNKAGVSKPVELSIPVTTKKKLRKPKIDARHWNDIVKKKGQTVEIECKYTGVPEPEITWVRVDEVSTSVTGFAVHTIPLICHLSSAM